MRTGQRTGVPRMTSGGGRRERRHGPLRLIAAVAVTVSVATAVWAAYQLGFGAPSPAFYWIAGVCFLAIPVAGGWTIARTRSSRRARTTAAVASVSFVVQLALFVLAYSFGAYFLLAATVTTPGYCDGGYRGTGPRIRVAGHDAIVIAQDPAVTVATTVDPTTRASTTYVLRRPGTSVLYTIGYPDDTVAVALDQTSVVLFNNALGTFIDKHSGRPIRYPLTLDSYGANHRHASDNHGLGPAKSGVFETTGYFSFWRADGSVRLLEKLTFNGIQSGCLINGHDKTISEL